MATLQDYYLYAKLASAAYVPLEKLPVVDGASLADAADNLERLPEAFANQTFRVSTAQGLSCPRSAAVIASAQDRRMCWLFSNDVRFKELPASGRPV